MTEQWKPRKAGDKVWLAPGSAFTGESNLFHVLLPAEKELNHLGDDGRPEYDFCMLRCGNEDCREWANVEIVGAPEGRENVIGEYLYHVSECEMFDTPQPGYEVGRNIKVAEDAT